VIPPISKAAENSFDAVRLLAALQVAYVHAVAVLHLDPEPGWLWIVQFPGVPIFFTISGYLVFDSLLRWPLPQFAVRRLARIYPALIINILLIETLLYLADQTNLSGATWGQIGTFLVIYVVTASDEMAFLASGLDRSIRSFNGSFQLYPSDVLWTLTVELTFYLVVPLLALTRLRALQTIVIVAASIASFAYQRYLGSEIATYNAWPISVFVFPYFWMVGIGMLFRLWPPPAWSIKPGTMVLLAAFALVAWSRNLVWFEWKVNPSISASAQSIVLCLLALWLGYSPILKSRILAKNNMSYGLFLYHMLIVTALMNVAPSRWLLIVVLGGGMIAGLLSWHLIERPSMNLVARRQLPHRDV
jgi:peptidoglycan/LPS O-acetylase OafA/YrhL